MTDSMAQLMTTVSLDGDSAAPAPILPQLQSPLLRLPGEIRNKIYQYALEDSKPLRVIGYLHKAPYKTHARLLHQFNELKHTCRQLRKETAWMGVSPADTSYYSDYTPDAGSRVLSYNTEARGRYLRHTPIFHYAGFCERDPHLELAIFTQALRKGLGWQGLLTVGAVLELIMRRNGLRPRFMREVQRDFKFKMWDLDMFKRQVERTNGALLPSNIRIYPMEEYDEAEIRHSYPAEKDGLEDYVAQIRKWYKNGI